jgi:predicted O-methyltransferase YrrM
MIVKLKKILVYFKRLILNEQVLEDENSIKKPLASKSTYLKIFKEASNFHDESISNLENKFGYKIGKIWIDELALHTQVTIKKSKINYQHGRALYATLRKYITENKKNNSQIISIVETGTARGFSAICMSKAINDSNIKGKIYTIDLLPINKPMYWNIIDDNEKKKTRAELLEKWPNELENITFIEGKTQSALKNLKIQRVNFAFLDAQHDFISVMEEFEYIKNRQKKGDIIFFDDVTKLKFPGVVKALKEIEREGLYFTEYLDGTKERAYVLAKKK